MQKKGAKTLPEVKTNLNTFLKGSRKKNVKKDTFHKIISVTTCPRSNQQANYISSPICR